MATKQKKIKDINKLENQERGRKLTNDGRASQRDCQDDIKNNQEKG